MQTAIHSSIIFHNHMHVADSQILSKGHQTVKYQIHLVFFYTSKTHTQVHNLPHHMNVTWQNLGQTHCFLSHKIRHAKTARTQNASTLNSCDHLQISCICVILIPLRMCMWWCANSALPTTPSANVYNRACGSCCDVTYVDCAYMHHNLITGCPHRIVCRTQV